MRPAAGAPRTSHHFPHPVRLLALVACTAPLFAAAPPLTRRDAGPPDGRVQFRNYGSEQGLHNLSLADLAQDREGYLWAATEGGAYRYDGTGFRLWSLAQGLPSSSVNVLRAEADGTLWMGTMAGLVRLRDGAVTVAPAREPLRIYSLARNAAGVLHAGTDTGLFRMGADGALAADPAWSEGSVSMLLGDSGRGGLLVGAGHGGLWREAPGGGYSPLPGGEALPQEPVKAMLVDGAGRLWARTVSRLFRQDAPGAPFRDLSAGLPDLRISIFEVTLHLDREGTLYLPTNSGLIRVRDERWDLLGPAQGLPSSWCNLAFVDREGSLWVASDGLHRLKGFGIWSNHAEADGLPNSIIWGLARDADGRLLASTSGGLARLGPAGWRAIPSFAGRTSYHLVRDAAGDVWSVGPPMTLLRLKRGTDALDSFPLASGRGGSAFTNLLIDRGGAFWIGTFSEGLHRMTLEGGRPRFEKIDLPGAEPDGYIHDIREDAEGRVWVSGDHGLAVLEQGSWRRFGVADGLRNARVFSLAFMPDGTLWASYGEPLGITRARLRGDRLEILGHLTVAEGLATDQVYSLGVDARGDLWMGTSRAVDRLHDGRVIHYGAGDGLRGEDFNYFSFLADPDGDVWMGSTNSLGHYHAARDPGPAPPPAARLTELSAGRRRLADPPAEGAALPFRDNTLEFRFTALSFLDEPALRFQARMEGLGEEWREVDVREARYPALPPGRYRFEVRAARRGGPFGTPASFAVEIAAPWWRRGWSYSLYALALVIAAWAVLRWRFGALRARNAELERLVTERTRELREMSTTDPATGLRNRRHLDLALPERLAALRRAHRDHREGRPGAAPAGYLGLFLLDLDHFKAVNDMHGHVAGDRVLVETGRRLRGAGREDDLAIRWGGEEFLFIASLGGPEAAAVLAAKLREIVGGNPFTVGPGTELGLGVSIGYTLYPFSPGSPDRPSWEEAVRIADHCLYAAKRSGRDAWVGLLPAGERAPPLAEILESTAACIGRGDLRVTSSLPAASLQWDARKA